MQTNVDGFLGCFCNSAGFLSTHLRLRGVMQQGTMAGEQIHNSRIPTQASILGSLQGELLQADMENGVRGSHGGARHDLPVLQ